MQVSASSTGFASTVAYQTVELRKPLLEHQQRQGTWIGAVDHIRTLHQSSSRTLSSKQQSSQCSSWLTSTSVIQVLEASDSVSGVTSQRAATRGFGCSMYNRAPFWARWTQPAAFKRKTDGHYNVLAVDPSQRQLALHPERISEVQMDVENGSTLAISYFPAYVYNPSWARIFGHKTGSTLKVQRVEGSRVYVHLDTSAGPHPTPPMAWYTCFLRATWPWLIIPALPPGLWIDIRTEKMEGWIDVMSGDVSFDYVSSFVNHFLITTTEPLAVSARMSTAEQSGDIFHATGERLRGGKGKLVAISRVPPTKDTAQNFLMQLPTDALTLLNVQFTFVEKEKEE